MALYVHMFAVPPDPYSDQSCPKALLDVPHLKAIKLMFALHFCVLGYCFLSSWDTVSHTHDWYICVALVRIMLSKHWALQELEARIRLDASAARQEILQMCEGMKRITLPVSTNADVSRPC